MNESKIEEQLDTIIRLLERQNLLLQSNNRGTVNQDNMTGNVPDVKSMIDKARKEAQAKIQSSSLASKNFNLPALS